jgi:hypothetical protein
MRRGDFATAWAVNDAVLAGRDPARRDDPGLPYHLRWVWDGRPFEGRDVLVRCYHGLGDTLQFVRYLAPLRARVAALALEVQPALVPLLRGLPGPDRLIPFRADAPAPPAACEFEIMELPHALRLAPPVVAAPYLTARPAALCAQAALCWGAGDWDARRSVPLHALLGALRLRHAVSVQRGRQATEAVEPAFLNPRDADPDILRTASLLAAAPVVVTVDTMVAHLAGALGRPTWLLLHAAPDWRWMEGRADSPWYPSLRLLRQHRPGDWSVPLAALRRAFSSRAAG